MKGEEYKAEKIKIVEGARIYLQFKNLQINKPEMNFQLTIENFGFYLSVETVRSINTMIDEYEQQVNGKWSEILE